MFTSDSPHGKILLPRLNVEHTPWSAFRTWFGRALRVDISSRRPEDFPNFVWVPFDLLGFFQVHRPFENAFSSRYGFQMSSLGGVLSALGVGALRSWREDTLNVYRDWQRAYDGPLSRPLLVESLMDLMPAALK